MNLKKFEKMQDNRVSIVDTPGCWRETCSEFAKRIVKEFHVYRVHRQMDEYGPKMVVWLTVLCDLMPLGENTGTVEFKMFKELEHAAYLRIPAGPLWDAFAKGHAFFFMMLEQMLDKLNLQDKVRISFAYPQRDRCNNKKGQGTHFIQMHIYGEGSKAGYTMHGPPPRDFYMTDEPLVRRIVDDQQPPKRGGIGVAFEYPPGSYELPRGPSDYTLPEGYTK
jgi:hypothetical protein